MRKRKLYGKSPRGTEFVFAAHLIRILGSRQRLGRRGEYAIGTLTPSCHGFFVQIGDNVEGWIPTTHAILPWSADHHRQLAAV